MDLKIALINPEDVDIDSKYGLFKNFKSSAIPAGIGFLAGYLRHKGYKNIKIFDEQISSLNNQETLKELAAFNPEIVGISCYTNLLGRTLDIASMVKEVLPDTAIITGSSHPSLEADSMIENECIDYILRGEGEVSLFNFLEKYHSGDFSKVDGLTYKKNGKVTHNKDVVPIKNLDDLPLFPYDMFAVHKEYDIGKICGSRGCPYRCAFCSSRWTSGTQYRYHSAERVVEEIEILIKKYGVDHIEFYDDNFNVSKRRTTQICDLILEKGLKFKWKCQTRSNSLNLEVAKSMKAAGCYFVSLGFESGSERILEMMKKDITVEDHFNGVEIVKKAGMHVGGGFILGYPTETREETQMTLDLVKKLKVDYASFSLFVPYPGTEVLDLVKKEGKDIDWNACSTITGLSEKNKLAYVPDGRTEEELSGLQRNAAFRFWLKPKRIFKFLSGQLSPYGKPHRVTLKEMLMISFFVMRFVFKFFISKLSK